MLLIQLIQIIRNQIEAVAPDDLDQSKFITEQDHSSPQRLH